MTLNEFIDHIKHNSLGIDIFIEGQIQFVAGTIGEFKNAVIRQKIGNLRIEKIEPLSQSLNIFLERK